MRTRRKKDKIVLQTVDISQQTKRLNRGNRRFNLVHRSFIGKSEICHFGISSDEQAAFAKQPIKKELN